MDIYKKHYNKNINYEVSFSRKRRIFKLLDDVKDKKILDIGCASGYLGVEFKKMGASEVNGIDISTNQIKEAKKVLDNVFSLDIQEDRIPFNNGYFDIIIFAEVVEHLLYPEKAIEEIKRVLKKDGIVIITTPNFLVFSNRIKMFFGKFDYTDTGIFDRGHVHFFSYKSLLKFVKKGGFEIIEENNLIHPKVPKFLGKMFPKIFVFQVIIKLRINS